MGAEPLGLESVLGLLATAIDPAWTRGERFSLAFAVPDGDVVHLQIRDGEVPVVARPPAWGRTAATITGTPQEIAARLLSGGALGSAAQLHGDAGPVQLVGDWAKRASSG